MDALHHWRLCDELTVLQAALLIVGEDPSVSQEFVQNWETTNRPSGYDAAFAALKNAILSNRLPATIRHAATERGWIRDPMNHEAVGTDSRNVQIFYNIDPSWDRTTVYVEDLRAWLRTRGVITGYFFPESLSSTVPYLNPQHPNYAPKLAAAINAWEAVAGDTSSKRSKTAKQALLVWLRKNAAHYGLTNKDGNPNEQGIEEVSKIANWDQKGGAPRTPGA
jgi:hypothetical protein